MVSIALCVLLLATYAYSVPVGMNDVSKQNSISKLNIMNLVDDGETTVLPTFGQVKLTTERNGLRFTTPGSFLNKERVPREMLDISEPAVGEMNLRGMEESSTWFPTTVESSSQSVVRPPREMLDASAPAVGEMNLRGIDESSTWFPTTFESSSQSVVRPPREMLDISEPAVGEMNLRGMDESSTWFPTTFESSSQSIVRPPREMLDVIAPAVGEMNLRGIDESSTWFPSTVETSTQFNQRKIRGQYVELNKDLQTTEEPSSSVSSFAQTTGLLRPQRGEQVEDQESSSMTMDESTTEFSSTVQPKTVIEVIPGRNTKTEIIPGPNTKTEIIPGSNTKTEIITRVPGRLVGGNRELSQGQN